jgi:hypothetical protein
MWGGSAISDDKKMGGYVSNNPLKAVANIRDVLSAWKYHVDDDIANILIAQRDRVGDKFAAVEKALDGITYNNILPYKSMDLQTAWNTWSSGRVRYAKKKAEDYMTTWLQKLKDGHATQKMREDAAKAAKNGQDEKQNLIRTIDLLEAAVKARPTWNMPF